MRLSIVIPCFNEESVLPQTCERLKQAAAELPVEETEMIFVDDGSRDRTGLILSEIVAHDDNVRVIRLARNFGHQMALTAGLESATGDAVVVIDADLQDPPELIASMLEKWREGSQVVYGVRTTRPGETKFKIWTAKLFYRLINQLSDTYIPADAGDFRLMDRSVVNALLAMPERDRFIRGMVSWVGFKQTPVEYERAPRSGGKTKYSLSKMMRLAADGILSFSIVPLKLAIWIGFTAIGLASLGILMAFIERVFQLYDVNISRGWASLFIAVMFLGGVQLLTIGIIGEYLGRIYIEVKRRPLYIVSKRLGFNDDK